MTLHDTVTPVTNRAQEASEAEPRKPQVSAVAVAAVAAVAVGEFDCRVCCQAQDLGTQTPSDTFGHFGNLWHVAFQKP